ncbi:PBS lyase, partial [Calothrix sp. UHCC 0171]|nr:PBS lyase [Calothrix sp. UHCC 0171]
FCLDPLAEYLAGLYLVEMYENNEGKWRSHFLKKAEDLLKNNHQDGIKGFLIAVADCYLSQISNAKDADFVPQKLSKLTGVVPSTQSLIP